MKNVADSKTTERKVTICRVPRARQILGDLAPSDASLYMLVSRRQIPYHKVGRRLIFVEEELQQWLADQIK